MQLEVRQFARLVSKLQTTKATIGYKLNELTNWNKEHTLSILPKDSNIELCVEFDNRRLPIVEALDILLTRPLNTNDFK